MWEILFTKENKMHKASFKGKALSQSQENLNTWGSFKIVSMKDRDKLSILRQNLNTLENSKTTRNTAKVKFQMISTHTKGTGRMTSRMAKE